MFFVGAVPPSVKLIPIIVDVPKTEIFEKLLFYLLIGKFMKIQITILPYFHVNYIHRHLPCYNPIINSNLFNIFLYSEFSIVYLLVNLT